MEQLPMANAPTAMLNTTTTLTAQLLVAG